MDSKEQKIEKKEDNKDDEKIQVSLPGERTNKTIPKRKIDYALKLRGLLDEFSKCLIVGVTNVGSKQVSDLRKELRGKARFLFGKNTMIRKIIRDHVKETGNKKLMNLMEICKGNTGFCFTKEDVGELRKKLINDLKQCSAKAGAIAPTDVWVKPGPTGMEPTQTHIFQAMEIPTRINRGQIDITDPVQLIFKDTKVGASEASLLVKLGVKPFYYGLSVVSIYEDGKVYDASVLDITDDDIANAVFYGLRNVAALSYTLDYPTISIVPHVLLRAYKKVLSLGLVGCKTYSWEGLETVKTIIENPDAFKAPPKESEEKKKDDVPVKEKSESEKESVAGPTNMFGGGGDTSSSGS